MSTIILPHMNKWLIAVLTGIASFAAGWATHSQLDSKAPVIVRAAHDSAHELSDGSEGNHSESEQLPPSATSRDDTEALKATFAAAIANPSPRAQLREFLPFLEELTSEKASALLPIIGKLPMFKMSDYVCDYLFLTRWGELDPEGALKVIKELKGKEGFSPNATDPLAVMDGWASKDPAGLIRYADRMEPGSKDRAMAVIGVVEGLSRRDLDAAGRFMLSQPDLNDPSTQQARLQLMQRALDKDRLDLAIGWYERALPGAAKTFFAFYTAEFLQKTDPTAAAAFKSRPDVQEALKPKSP
jgi:hypothetical protein